MTVGIEAAQMQAALSKLAEGGGAQAKTPAELADKFQTLMQQAQLAPPSDPNVDGMQTASRLLSEQETEYRVMSDDFKAFSSVSPEAMTLQETTMASMKLMSEMQTANLNLQAKMGVVQSSKSSVETLMKNQ